MFGLNPMELLIVGGVAILLFGSRLPSVARSLGKSLTEFKRGMTDIQDEVRGATSIPARAPTYRRDLDDREESSAPKFEPPTSEPQEEASSAAPSEKA